MNELSQMMNKAKIMKQKQPIPQIMSQSIPQMMNQPPPSQMMSQPMPIVNRSYGMWPPPPPFNPAMDPMMFQNPYAGGKPPGLGRSNWKGQKGMDKQNDLMIRRNEQQQVQHKSNAGNQVLPNKGGGGYQPPTLQELQSQNWNKARKYYHPKKKYNNRFAPYAPRNTSSFIIRAKKSGGIASLVSPCPVTPAVLPTPVFSPSREVLGDIAKEEWGVDGYGSMKGLIRLRSNYPDGDGDEDEDEDEDGSSDSDVEEHVEVERRLDHDLSRFEMVYPNGAAGDYNNLLENKVDDQDTHIAHLEEENLTLKERLFLMEREMGDMRRRLQIIERLIHAPGDVIEEVVENGSDNDAESGGRCKNIQLGVGYNVELEDVEERRGDDHAQNLNDTIESNSEEKEKNVMGDVNIEDPIDESEQDSSDEDLHDANHKNLCGPDLLEQAIDEGAANEKVTGGPNVEKR